MTKSYTLESAKLLWMEFFGLYGLGHAIREVAQAWPDRRSVRVPFRELARFSPDLAEFLVERPHQACYSADQAALEGLPAALKAPIHVRFEAFPSNLAGHSPRIRDVRAAHLGRLVALKGVVRRRSEVLPRVSEAVFQCVRCGAAIEVPQEGTTLKEPLECYEDQGGCKRSATSTKFHLLMGPASLQDPFEEPREGRTLRFSETLDYQTAELVELSEGLRGGEEPQRIQLQLEDDLVGRLKPGDRLVANGTLRERQRGRQSAIFDLYLDTLSLELELDEDTEDAFTPTEVEHFTRFGQHPNVVERLASSIAPALYGLGPEKEALVLQLFGGVTKLLPDGTRVRGDSHILLIGDPGTGKSQLLRYMAALSPRGVLASGKSASAAGLTAAAVKEDDHWALEAGALVLADKGLAAVDELDKMSPQDRDAMHEAMEQQTISVNKAGIQATLQSRCSILGAANPKFGRFDPHQYFVEQLDLPPALIGRFDLILVMTDKPNREFDQALAAHVLRTHHLGERLAAGQAIPQATPDLEGVGPEFIRRYVKFAKESCFPELTQESGALLASYYTNTRKAGEAEASAVPITARQLEGLIRLSEASARARLSPKIERQDAERAIAHVQRFLRKLAGEGGALDIDIIAAGTSRSQREAARTLLEIVRELDAGGGVTEDDILGKATSQGVEQGRAREMLQRLQEQGQIYAPDRRHYKIASR